MKVDLAQPSAHKMEIGFFVWISIEIVGKSKKKKVSFTRLRSLPIQGKTWCPILFAHYFKLLTSGLNVI